MKTPQLKKVFFILFFILGLNFSAKAQDETAPILRDDIQPMMLMENKITFYDEQINFESIVIEPIDGLTASTILPQLTISADHKTVTIDFTACAPGEFVISAKRDELEMQYLIDFKK